MANLYTKSLIANFVLIYDPKISKKMQIEKVWDSFLSNLHKIFHRSEILG